MVSWNKHRILKVLGIIFVILLCSPIIFLFIPRTETYYGVEYTYIPIVDIIRYSNWVFDAPTIIFLIFCFCLVTLTVYLIIRRKQKNASTR